MGPNNANKALALIGVAIAVLMLLAVPFMFGTDVFAPVGSVQSEVNYEATSTARYETEMVRVSTAVADMWQGHCQYLLDFPNTRTDDQGRVIINVFENQCLRNLTRDQVQTIFDGWIKDANGGVLKLTSLDPYKVGFNGNFAIAKSEWVVTNRGESNENWQEEYLLPESFVISGVSSITITGCENLITPLTGELVIYDCHGYELIEN